MARYLSSVDSVHDAAAACDSLEDRVEPDDAVFVASVDGGEERDAAEATKVLRVRLPSARIAPLRTEVPRVEDVLDAARAADADLIVPCGRDVAWGSGDGSIFEAPDREVVVLRGD